MPGQQGANEGQKGLECRCGILGIEAGNPAFAAFLCHSFGFFLALRLAPQAVHFVTSFAHGSAGFEYGERIEANFRQPDVCAFSGAERWLWFCRLYTRSWRCQT